jgi:hypothetical protein
MIELQYKVMGHVGQPSARWFSQLLEDIRKQGMSWKEMEKQK